MALAQRWTERLHIARTVIPAVAIAFLIDVALSRTDLRAFVGFLSAYFTLFIVFFFVGRWIGKRTWPSRGHALARTMLRRRLRREHEFVFLSHRPDRSFTTLQRVWEVVGFAAGVSLLLSTLIGLLGLASFFPSVVLPLLVPILVTWGSFVLLPYWLFARLGLRTVDPLRWLVLPLSRRYAARWKLSNGALILLAAGAVFNLAFRAGASGGEALAVALTLVLRVAAVVLVVGATAVAYYVREERVVAAKLEQEALSLGIRDGRGMTDGDFLPRLPVSKT